MIKLNIIISIFNFLSYKMAPENPFPGPLEDCIKVTEYVLNHHTTLHLDLNRYMLAGDSAGCTYDSSTVFTRISLSFNL